jgi:hypothetical protein
MAWKRMSEMRKNKIAQGLRDWIEARKCFRLSYAHVQMAREVGMNPRKLGKLDNHHQEPWKAPLPQFIERLYFTRFGRERPEVVISAEEWARAQLGKRSARKEVKLKALAKGNDHAPGEGA